MKKDNEDIIFLAVSFIGFVITLVLAIAWGMWG